MKSFNTKADVLDYLANDCGMDCTSTGNYFDRGEYVLNHGEYSQPDYVPRRYKDGWGIHANYYYYQGTYHAPRDGRVNIDVVYDQDATVEGLVKDGVVDKDALRHLEVTPV